jgi:Protein of unknown function (DUF1579)
MYRKLAIAAVLVYALLSDGTSFAQKAGEDPLKKLGAFLGKWHTEGIFENGTKAKSELECRWSPEKRYLICEQDITLSSGRSHQLTIYGYDEKSGRHTFLTWQDNSSKPAAGFVEIKDNVWAYDFSVDDENGKPTQVRTTNEFTNPKTELFKVYVSDDHGATWKLLLQGTAHKVGD